MHDDGAGRFPAKEKGKVLFRSPLIPMKYGPAKRKAERKGKGKVRGADKRV